jgi:hypothetical protein
VFEKLPSRDTKIGIFLEALHQEIFDGLLIHSLDSTGSRTHKERHYRRGTLRERRMIVVDNAEKSRHRLEIIVRGLPL